MAHGQAIDRQLVDEGLKTPQYRQAVELRAERQAIREAVVLRIFEKIARLVGVPEDYFQHRFKEEMAEELIDVPNENIIAPPGNVAGPALQNMSFSIDDQALRGMYIKLLARASDDRAEIGVHPSFVSVISQLDSREALIFRDTIGRRTNIPIVELRLRMDGHGMFRTMLRNLCNWRDENGLPREEAQGSSFVDNWARLGLVEVDYSTNLLDPGNYDWTLTRPELLELQAQPVEGGSYYSHNGIMSVTDYGRQFADAVGLSTL